jgi:hypothetical protein
MVTTISGITNLGENNGDGATSGFDALFLKKFGGEVATSYGHNLVLMPRVRQKTLKGGKSYTFGAIGRTTATHHVRAQVVRDAPYVGEITLGERIIFLDRPIVAEAFTDQFEEFVNHFDVRGPIADELGAAISELIEDQLMRLLVIGSDSTAGPVADQPGGNDMVYPNAGTNGADLVEAIKEQALYWNNNRVPKAGRFCIVPPTQYQMLAERTDFHSMDINNGRNGSLREGEIGRMYGMDILESTLVPSTDTSSDDAPDYGDNGLQNDYRVDAADCVGVFGTPRALGAVQIGGVMIESEYERKDKGTWFDASKIFGAGVLRESDCGSVRTLAI